MQPRTHTVRPPRGYVLYLRHIYSTRGVVPHATGTYIHTDVPAPQHRIPIRQTSPFLSACHTFACLSFRFRFWSSFPSC